MFCGTVRFFKLFFYKPRMNFSSDFFFFSLERGAGLFSHLRETFDFTTEKKISEQASNIAQLFFQQIAGNSFG